MTESPSAWVTVSWTSEGLTFALGGLLAGWPDPNPPAPPRSATDIRKAFDEAGLAHTW